MRVLIINKFLHRNGGSETYIFKLGEALEQHGHEVQYFGMEHEGRCVGNRVNAYTSDMDFHGGSNDFKNHSKTDDGCGSNLAGCTGGCLCDTADNRNRKLYFSDVVVVRDRIHIFFLIGIPFGDKLSHRRAVGYYTVGDDRAVCIVAVKSNDIIFDNRVWFFIPDIDQASRRDRRFHAPTDHGVHLKTKSFRKRQRNTGKNQYCQ